MHVAIDLGEKHTYLACWDTGRPVSDACISVKIPGLAVLNPSAGSSLWARDSLWKYISYIHREYLLPSRMVIESAALAVPDIFSLNSRRVLLDVFEEVLGLAEVMIIPHFIALAVGYQLRHEFSLTGDVMVLEVKESSFDCAFLSVTDGVGITLEKQSRVTLNQVMELAEKQGYWSPSGWKLDHLLLLGNDSQIPALEGFVASLPPNLNVISDSDLSSYATEGLSRAVCDDDNVNPVGRLSMIYPYKFYLESFNPDLDTTTLVRIPFDISNLELDWGDKYRLISLNSASISIPASPEARVNFRIYEIHSDYEPDSESISRSSLVLEIDSFRDDLPPCMELGLDMAAARLQLDLKPQPGDTAIVAPQAFWMHHHTNHEQLYELIRARKQNEGLLKDWDYFLSSSHSAGPTLSQQVETTLFHLYGLLQLWHGK